MNVVTFPLGLKIILAVLVVGAIGTAIEIVISGELPDWEQTVWTIADIIVLAGILLRSRIGYFGFLILAGITIVGGFALLVMAIFWLYQGMDSSNAWFFVLLVPFLGFWVWAYIYMRKSPIQELFFNEI